MLIYTCPHRSFGAKELQRCHGVGVGEEAGIVYLGAKTEVFRGARMPRMSPQRRSVRVLGWGYWRAVLEETSPLWAKTSLSQTSLSPGLTEKYSLKCCWQWLSSLLWLAYPQIAPAFQTVPVSHENHPLSLQRPRAQFIPSTLQGFLPWCLQQTLKGHGKPWMKSGICELGWGKKNHKFIFTKHAVKWVFPSIMNIGDKPQEDDQWLWRSHQ